ncbi:MAG: metalloregulator ArsR/SmtB family transcription factor [Terriglobia bacterium]
MHQNQGDSANNGYLYERQAQVCKAFANPTRLHILDLLGRKARSVSELQGTLGVSKANLSQHLGILRNVGTVVTCRKGKQVYCALAFPEIKQACGLMRQVLRRLRSR